MKPVNTLHEYIFHINIIDVLFSGSLLMMFELFLRGHRRVVDHANGRWIVSGRGPDSAAAVASGVHLQSRKSTAPVRSATFPHPVRARNSPASHERATKSREKKQEAQYFRKITRVFPMGNMANKKNNQKRQNLKGLEMVKIHHVLSLLLAECQQPRETVTPDNFLRHVGGACLKNRSRVFHDP